jgi:flavin-dependent dehydrogenase
MGLEMADNHSEKMKGSRTYDVIIAGGGLAGLTSAILLGRAGLSTLLIEKKDYPYHKVCGEYVSNEVKPFFRSIGIDVSSLGASEISKLRISSPNGSSLHTQLDMGGFGISRYKLDHHLYNAASQNAEVRTGTRVHGIKFRHDMFTVTLSDGEVLHSKMVIGSYGKREVLDKTLKRNFIFERTGYMAVKYHIRTDYPADEIGLDNFKDGYCGIVKIEEDRYCLCYLTRRSNMNDCSSVKEMEEKVLHKNPVLKNIFSNAEFIYERPEVINEISFARKETVKDHVWMAGDTAGLITPLCGNGMSMAVHGAKLLCDHIIALDLPHKLGISLREREEAELRYSKAWKKQFSARLFAGRQIQRLFGSQLTTTAALGLIKILPPLQRLLIRSTHGQYF